MGPTWPPLAPARPGSLIEKFINDNVRHVVCLAAPINVFLYTRPLFRMDTHHTIDSSSIVRLDSISNRTIACECVAEGPGESMTVSVRRRDLVS